MKKILILIFIMTLPLFSQSFEKSNFVKVDGGIIIPFQDSYSLGPSLSIDYSLPIAQTFIINFTANFSLPNSSVDNSKVDNYGFSSDVILPLAPEANSTFYIGGGIGLFENSLSFKGNTISSGISPGLKGLIGYYIAPQSWNNVFLDFQLQYKNILYSEKSWDELNLLFGVGFFLN